MTPADEDLLTLRRRSRITGWFQLGWRIVAALSLIGILILFHWLERDGLKDNYDGHVSLLDVIYFTMISATTTGYGDIVPVTERTRLFDALIVTPIRILFLLFFIGTAYLFVARRTWEKFIMKRIQRSLRDHIVVIGFGTKNSRAVQELIDLGAEPETVVVIDHNEDRLLRPRPSDAPSSRRTRRETKHCERFTSTGPSSSSSPPGGTIRRFWSA